MEGDRYDGLYRHGLELRAFINLETLTDRPGAASWQGLAKAPQYSASKHGVLGLMRALDPVVAADNIRIAAIHPWFAGALTDRWTAVFVFNFDIFPPKTHRSSIFPQSSYSRVFR
jgi:NAD(P)-dependent dehydrogenase (short-subunit alcohol dehydrogenase family)